MKHILFSVFLLSMICTLKAQVKDYTFSHSDHGFTSTANDRIRIASSLTKKQGAIFINNGLPNDVDFSTGKGYPIGFDFYYDRQFFDHFAVSDNGYIKLGRSMTDFTIKRDTLISGVFANAFVDERQNILSAFQTDVSTSRRSSATIQFNTARGFPR